MCTIMMNQSHKLIGFFIRPKFNEFECPQQCWSKHIKIRLYDDCEKNEIKWFNSAFKARENWRELSCFIPSLF